MKEALARVLASMKFWTTVIGMVATAGSSMFAKWGLELSDEATQQIAITVSGFFGLLLMGQAATDHGKVKAEIQATANLMGSSTIAPPSVGVVAPHPDGATVALTNGEAHVITKDQLTAAGYVAKVGILFVLMMSFAGCSSLKDAQKPVMGSVINCMASSIAPVKQQFGALAEYAIIRSVGDDGSIDKAALKDSFRNAGLETGGCLLADAFSRLSKAALAALASGVKSEGVTVTAVQADAVLDDLYPGITFKVE